MALIRIDRTNQEDITTNDDARVEVVHYFKGFSNSVEDSFYTIRQDSLVPKVYSYDSSLGLYVKQVNVNRDESFPLIWDIVVVYSSEIRPPPENENPLDRPAKYGIRTFSETVPLIKLPNGRPPLNLANDYFADLTVDILRRTVTVTKNIAPNDMGWLSSISKNYPTVISDPMTIRGNIFEGESLKIESIDIPDETVFESNVEYLPVRFELREGNWKLRPWNKGIRERVKKTKRIFQKSGGNFVGPAKPKTVTYYVLQRIRDDEGRPIEEPFWLNEEGVALRTQDQDGKERLKSDFDESDFIALEFTPYIKVSINQLPLR